MNLWHSPWRGRGALACFREAETYLCYLGQWLTRPLPALTRMVDVFPPSRVISRSERAASTSSTSLSLLFKWFSDDMMDSLLMWYWNKGVGNRERGTEEPNKDDCEISHTLQTRISVFKSNEFDNKLFEPPPSPGRQPERKVDKTVLPDRTTVWQSTGEAEC